MPGKSRALEPERELHQLLEKAEKHKACSPAKLGHPLRLVKQQFGHAKVCFRGLAKRAARLTMLFALGNLWMACRQLLGVQG